MEEYKNMMLRHLTQINKLLNENQNSSIFDDLFFDKQILLFYLYGNNIDEKYRNFIFQLEKNDIIYPIMMNQTKYIPIKPFRIMNRRKNIDNLKIFNEFLKEDFFGLKESYDKILNDGTLFYTKDIPKSSGRTIYLNSINKNYVLVYKGGIPYDYSVTVHELGHVKQNLLKRDLFKQKLESNFSEAYTYFLTLAYFDYIKQFGCELEAFNYEYKFLQVLLFHFYDLYDSIDLEKLDEPKFQRQNALAISKLLAIYFYNIYLSTPLECLDMLETFNKNYENMNDYDLLKSIDINFNIFKSGEIIDTFINYLKKEKIRIKQK